MWITEKELEREIQIKRKSGNGDQFRWKKT